MAPLSYSFSGAVNDAPRSLPRAHGDRGRVPPMGASNPIDSNERLRYTMAGMQRTRSLAPSCLRPVVSYIMQPLRTYNHAPRAVEDEKPHSRSQSLCEDLVL